MRNYNQQLKDKLATLNSRSSSLSRQMLVELSRIRSAQAKLETVDSAERFSAHQLENAQAALAAREADGRDLLDRVLETKGEVSRLQQAENEAKITESAAIHRSVQIEREIDEAEVDISVYKKIKRDHRLLIIEDSLSY